METEPDRDLSRSFNLTVASRGVCNGAHSRRCPTPRRTSPTRDSCGYHGHLRQSGKLSNGADPAPLVGPVNVQGYRYAPVKLSTNKHPENRKRQSVSLLSPKAHQSSPKNPYSTQSRYPSTPSRSPPRSPASCTPIHRKAHRPLPLSPPSSSHLLVTFLVCRGYESHTDRDTMYRALYL